MTTRRNFIKQVGLTGAGITLGAQGFSAQSYNRIVGANERLNVAVMGTNGRGNGMARSFQNQPNVEMIFVCDVDERALAKGMETVRNAGGSPKGEKDIRKVLESKDLDALLITAPDFWHAPATVMACQAGKHVYVEKPGSFCPGEGEMNVAAARKYNRIVQGGSQRRSWTGIQEGINLMKEGAIGKVYFARCWYTNRRGSIGVGQTVPVPAWLDYDLWQGPVPRRDFRSNLIHYNWHWFLHWGTGEALNNGSHEVDVARWGLGVDFPTAVSSEGGRYAFTDDWEFPDTQVITAKYGDDCMITWEGRTCNSFNSEGRDRGVIFYGTNGTMETGFNGYRIFDSRGNLVKELDPKEVIDGRDTSSPNANLDVPHIQNFIDCIKNNRRPNADVEELHKSTTMLHLGNIAWRTGKRLNLNPSNGHILNNIEATNLWNRTYEPGWEPKV